MPGAVAIVPGVGEVAWAAPYEGVARELIAALKFRARLTLVRPLAAAIAAALPPIGAEWSVVAVPAAPGRRRRRGFDPAELLAAALAAALGLELAAPLRRSNGPRQVGRRRRERLAAPPGFRAVVTGPRRALLVDDVLTTGATLRSCALALRVAGCVETRGAVFARALGERSVGA
jgi:competence protein ComFC